MVLHRPIRAPEPLTDQARLQVEVRRRRTILWWRSTRGEWRVVSDGLWTAQGDAGFSWNRGPAAPQRTPEVWDVVYSPIRARQVVVAVRVLRVLPTVPTGAGSDRAVAIAIRGLTAEGREVELSTEGRDWFDDPIAAALEIGCPPRLEDIIEFEC